MVRTYLELKVSGVEVIQPFQEDLLQNCNLFGEKKNEWGKRRLQEVQCTKYQVPCIKYHVPCGRQAGKIPQKYDLGQNTNPYFVLRTWYLVQSPTSSFFNQRSTFDISLVSVFRTSYFVFKQKSPSK